MFDIIPNYRDILFLGMSFLQDKENTINLTDQIATFDQQEYEIQTSNKNLDHELIDKNKILSVKKTQHKRLIN